MIDGFEPGDAGFALTAENTPAVRAWLISEGLDPARVEGMRNDSLAKAYRYPAYLRQMKTRADYYPSCAKPKDHTPCTASITLPGKVGESSALTTLPAAPPTPPPTPIAPTSTVDTSCGEFTPLIEARVVELIEDHVIRVLLERLQLMELLK